jgi:hypothetical protein
MESYSEGDVIFMTVDGYSDSDQSSSDTEDEGFFCSKKKVTLPKIIPSTPDSPPESLDGCHSFLKRIRCNINKDYENMTSTDDFKKLKSYASKLKIKGIDVKGNSWITLANGEDFSHFTIRRNITMHIHDKLNASKTTASVLGAMITGRLLFNTSFGEDIDETLNRVVDQISPLRKEAYLESRKSGKSRQVVVDSDSEDED